MNKKQVNALLKIIPKDGSRVALEGVHIMKYNDRIAIAATDGFKLAIIYMDGAEALEGRFIPREVVERWYKLATGKDRLNGTTLVDELSKYAVESSFPDVLKVMPQGEPVPQSEMIFNAEFFKIVQDIANEDRVVVTLYGNLSPMVMNTEMGTFVVMPMRRV